VRAALETLRAEAAAAFGDAARLDEPMRDHTRYRIGGPADVFVRASSVELLRTAVEFARRYDAPLFVIGHGSNLLVPDEGLRGLVARVEVRTLRVEGTALIAGAGLPLPQAAGAAHEHALTGLEFAVGIPGTVGGALVMNAGCRGSEIGPLVEGAEVVEGDGTLRTLERGECRFGYRSSNLPGEAAAIAGATLRLAHGDRADIERRMDEHRAWRAKAQPHEHPSAGSVFKNPPGDAAGRLIEAAGCKGLRLGGAEVSSVHANFIVNRGDATYADIKALIAAVRERVEAHCGVALELELVDLGDIKEGAAH
jgi:UDP-N-acetylmuramate dehydrogenase